MGRVGLLVGGWMVALAALAAADEPPPQPQQGS